MVDVLQNWLNWFHFLFLEGDLLVILIDCMIFQSPFLEVKKKRKKIQLEILGDSMLNGVQEKGLNKNADINIKIRKYPGASSTDILDHIRPSFRKKPDQIITHAGTNVLKKTIII